MSESIVGEISWNEMLEGYFASTGEKAHCLSWIHKKSEERYAQLRTFIDLPVIAISSITGFLSVGSTSMFGNNQMAVSVSLGLLSLLVSVLNTTGTYFAWAKRAEGHRITSIQYARLYRFLSIEMSLPRDERMNPHDLLKHVKDQYDRLQEISPLVPPAIILEFQRKFKNDTDISKPEEANGLEKIVVFPNPLRDRGASSLPPPTPSVGTPNPPWGTELGGTFGSRVGGREARQGHPMGGEIGLVLREHHFPQSGADTTVPAPSERATAPSTE